MAFSKAVLLVVFSVLLISAEVSALRDLAETTTTPTTDQGGKPGGGLECSKNRNMACYRNRVPKCKTPYSRECHKYGNGGKGGRGPPGPETVN